jgi:flavin reductase (DIM6/NTAB) family NADH-FMN oxidoreductase RutF
LRIDVNALPAAAQYKLICSTVIPRPIALVTTWSEQGGDNAAPFSYFNAMGEDPPILVLGIELRRDAEELKDTGINIRDTGQFVVNLVDEPMAQAMNVCAIDFPPGVSEIEQAGLQLAPSERVRPGRIIESPVSFECELMHWLHVSPRRYMAVAKVVMMHVRDGLYDPQTGYIDHSKFKPLGRYFGRLYTNQHELFEMTVPSLQDWMSQKAEVGR